jgi:integrase
MKLTDRAIANLKATGKQHKHFDGGGLYVHVSPVGGKLWRLFYRFNGKDKLLSFGAYPAVSLKMARERRDEAKALLAQGIDPSEYKKEVRKAQVALTEHCFQNIAREWHLKFRSHWTPKHSENIMNRLEKLIFPHIGDSPISQIKPTDVLAIIRPIEARDALETAHRVMQICGKVFRYAVATGRAERDVTADLRGAIPPRREKHHATITNPVEVGKLLRAIDSYEGQFAVACALKLAPLVFVRPGELRQAEWSEFNFESTEWRIPAERMKMREQHIVPLARQTLEILASLRKATGNGKYLFPSIRTDTRPMSNNTVNAALRRLGYAKEEMTGHGFRSMASTLLNEQGWNRDAIERQLAHSERNAVRAAYNFAEFLPERRKMMQAWADYLDALRLQR